MREPAVREMIAALGSYVRTTRQLLGWSQEGLAESARMSQGGISRIERGDCLKLPFMSVMKVLTALAAHPAPIGDAIPAPFAFVLACASRLPGARPAPPDPYLAQLLQAYQQLPVDRQPALVEMLQALVTMIENPQPQEQEITTG